MTDPELLNFFLISLRHTLHEIFKSKEVRILVLSINKWSLAPKPKNSEVFPSNPSFEVEFFILQAVKHTLETLG